MDAVKTTINVGDETMKEFKKNGYLKILQLALTQRINRGSYACVERRSRRGSKPSLTIC